MHNDCLGRILAAACFLALAACSERAPTEARWGEQHKAASFRAHTLTATPVASIQLTMINSANVGSQFSAIANGFDAQGNLLDLSTGYSVVWSSSNQGVATISGTLPETRSISAVGAGSASICAAVGQINGCTTVVVTTPGTLTGNVSGPTPIPKAGSYTYSADAGGGYTALVFEWWKCPTGQSANLPGNTCLKFATDTTLNNSHTQHAVALRNADGHFSIWVKFFNGSKTIWNSLAIDATHALDATISGPAWLQNVSGETCTWSGHPVGGTPPYRYQWSLDGGNYYPIGSTTAVNYTARLYGGSSHYASFSVTDAAGLNYMTQVYTPNTGYAGPVDWPCTY